MFEFDSSNGALCDGETRTWLSFREVGAKLDEIGGDIRTPEKSLVFLFCDNSIDSVLYYLACIQSGQAVALLNSTLDGGLKQRLVSIYKPELIIDVNPLANYSGGQQDAQYVLSSKQQSPGIWIRDKADLPAVHPELSLLLPTSGTTGSPKLVKLSRKNLIANANSIRHALAITENERAVTSLPLHYSYGLSVVNSHLAAGAGLVITSETLLSGRFWEIVRANECTSFAGVPYSYDMVRRLGLENLNVPSLKTLTQAGGKMSSEATILFNEAIRKRAGRLFVMYGQTEATARIAVLPPERLTEKLGSAGIAIPEGKLSVSIDGALTSEPDISGEIVYSGPNVMLGYAKDRSDLSVGDEMKGTLNTGDIGYLDKEGYLFLTGRSSRIAKVFGYRVDLDEIENLLKQYGPAAVVGSEDKIIIYCEASSSESLEARKEFLVAKLQLDRSAFELRRLQSLPRTSSGKIDYKSLQDTR